MNKEHTYQKICSPLPKNLLMSEKDKETYVWINTKNLFGSPFIDEAGSTMAIWSDRQKNNGAREKTRVVKTYDDAPYQIMQLNRFKHIIFPTVDSIIGKSLMIPMMEQRKENDMTVEFADNRHGYKVDTYDDIINLMSIPLVEPLESPFFYDYNEKEDVLALSPLFNGEERDNAKGYVSVKSPSAVYDNNNMKKAGIVDTRLYDHTDHSLISLIDTTHDAVFPSEKLLLESPAMLAAVYSVMNNGHHFHFLETGVIFKGFALQKDGESDEEYIKYCEKQQEEYEDLLVDFLVSENVGFVRAQFEYREHHYPSELAAKEEKESSDTESDNTDNDGKEETKKDK